MLTCLAAEVRCRPSHVIATYKTLLDRQSGVQTVRILTLSYEFPPIGGGGSAVAKGLACELVKKGHSVDVITMGFGDLPAKEVVDGVRVQRIDCGRRSVSKCTSLEALRYVRRARAVVRKTLSAEDYDLVHAHFVFPDGILAHNEAAPLGLPFIITAHGSDVPGYNSKRFFKAAHAILKFNWRSITRSAAQIISPSQMLATIKPQITT